MKTKQRQALVILTSLFFMWGFITCMNDILIPYLKKIFELSYFQAMLVQFAFFGAYFIGSLFYLLISLWKDPISVIGYKNGIIIGLLVSAVACLMFYPASQMHSYPVFLSALFVLGLGFTLLQITANPFVAILGSEESASSRLNLAQGFNSLGTTIAPIIGGYFIFHFFNKWGTAILNSKGEQILADSGDVITALGIQIPYLIFAGIFVLLAIVFYFSKLPEIKQEENSQGGFQVFKYRHLMLGFIAIFMYVGAEVSIGSMIINYLSETMAMPEMEAK
ncbi:MAG: MFS transporter, partial [Bacteroidales bacterium]|nr:MFS transporter [Bacteroidales bacterium]